MIEHAQSGYLDADLGQLGEELDSLPPTLQSSRRLVPRRAAMTKGHRCRGQGGEDVGNAGNLGGRQLQVERQAELANCGQVLAPARIADECATAGHGILFVRAADDLPHATQPRMRQVPCDDIHGVRLLQLDERDDRAR